MDLSDRIPTRRVFFALLPDESTRDEFARLLRSIPRRRGKPVAVDNLHITLAFIGSVDETMRLCLQGQAAQIRAEPFSFILSRIGFFSRARVMWLGPQSCPEALQVLVRHLNEGLSYCGYRPDPRPFAAHMTLFRKAQPSKPNMEVSPVQWRADAFCLMESKTYPGGVQYHVLQHYPLGS